MAMSNVPLEKTVDMKCMQVNVLKNIARATGKLTFLLGHMRILESIYTL